MNIGINMDKCIAGIINIESIDISCSFIVEDFVVTLIPEQDETSIRKLREWAEKIYDKDEIEWLSGITSDNKPIYIARRLQGGYTSGSERDIGAINFFSSMIIENNDSLHRVCNGFYGIEFIGGAINLVYPPDKAIEHTPNRSVIKYKEPTTYTDVYNIELNDENFRLIKTIDVRYIRQRGKVVDLARNIQSTLRLEFEEEKTFQDLNKYYDYISNLVTFLCRISTNNFEVKLLTKDNINGKEYYQDFAFAKLYKGVSCVNSDILIAQDVLQLDDMGEELVKIFKLLNDKQFAPNLLFLPDTVNDRGFIKYTQVIDICSAIEIEYKYGRQPEASSALKKESRAFAEKINQFIDSVESEDVLKCKAKSIIGSMLKNYNPSLKEKIKFLYQSYQDSLEFVVTNHSWLNSFTEEEFNRYIKLFVDMRHSTAHQKMNWNGGEAIYTHIMILIYLSIFERANISRNIAINSINHGFRNIF